MRKLSLVMSVASLAWLLAAPAFAQTTPSFGQPLGNARLSGTVVQFTPGSFALGLLDDRGNVDRVALHTGTIIEPIGIDLAPGMRIAIVGRNAGNVFVANAIRRELRRERAPYWYDRWVAPRTADAQNPPAPPVVNAPYR